MGFIPTRVHSITDYFLGIGLIAVPLAVSDTRGLEMGLPVAIGILLLLQNLVTDYEFTIADVVPVRGHLAMDSIAGGLLAISPWLFNFDEIVFLPHLVFGLGIWFAAMATEKHRRDRSEMQNPQQEPPIQGQRSPTHFNA